MAARMFARLLAMAMRLSRSTEKDSALPQLSGMSPRKETHLAHANLTTIKPSHAAPGQHRASAAALSGHVPQRPTPPVTNPDEEDQPNTTPHIDTKGPRDAESDHAAARTRQHITKPGKPSGRKTGVPRTTGASKVRRENNGDTRPAGEAAASSVAPGHAHIIGESARRTGAEMNARQTQSAPTRSRMRIHSPVANSDKPGSTASGRGKSGPEIFVMSRSGTDAQSPRSTHHAINLQVPAQPTRTNNGDVTESSPGYQARMVSRAPAVTGKRAPMPNRPERRAATPGVRIPTAEAWIVRTGRAGRVIVGQGPVSRQPARLASEVAGRFPPGGMHPGQTHPEDNLSPTWMATRTPTPAEGIPYKNIDQAKDRPMADKPHGDTHEADGSHDIRPVTFRAPHGTAKLNSIPAPSPKAHMPFVSVTSHPVHEGEHAASQMQMPSSSISSIHTTGAHPTPSMPAISSDSGANTHSRPVSGPWTVPAALHEIGRAAAQNRFRLELRLEPAHLGKIRVLLDSDENSRIQVHMVVDHGASRQAIEQHLPTLRHSLAQHGLDLGGFSMAFRQEHQGEQTPARRGRDAQTGREATQHGSDTADVPAMSRQNHAGLSIHV